MTESLTTTTTMRRLKRSRSLHMTSLMATIGFSMSACSGSDVPSPPLDPPEPTFAFTSLDECKTSGAVSASQCDMAYSAAQAEAETSAPRYATKAECEVHWGPEQCRPLNQAGGSFFGPLATGFIIGQLMNGGYRGGPLYRDRAGEYSNGYGGGRVWRDYRTGRTLTNAGEHTQVARQAPTRIQSRTAVVSRGGFGGGGRGFGG